MRFSRHAGTLAVVLVATASPLRPLEVAAAGPARPAVADVPVPHDLHEPSPVGAGPTNDVRGIAVTPSGSRVWAATAAGVYARDAEAAPPGHPAPWVRADGPESLAPAFAVVVQGTGSAPRVDGTGESAWVGAWNGLHRHEGGRFVPVPGVPGPVVTVALGRDGSVLAGGPDGYHWIPAGGGARRVAPGASRYVGRVSETAPGQWSLATGMGLFGWDSATGAGAYLRGPWEQESVALRDVAAGPGGKIWVAALGGLQEFDGRRWKRSIPVSAGLPSADVRSVAAGPDGRVWIGTALGVARGDGDRWEVRRGRRWLVSDEVRQVAVAPDGTAWVATADGVSALRQAPYSLAAKAAHFHRILESRHVRPPGIVEKCALRVPGDLSTWEPMDDDNDGGYTALAMAMESYRFAATGDPAARAAARRAWAACEFLQEVTGTPGFLARTVVPSDWKGEVHDPNETVDDATWADRRSGNPRDKRVPERWRTSADGRWRWKGDTSSDEMTAHFFGYYAFYTMAADEADRVRVRRQVCRLVDHLASHGWTLTDLDGRHTQWGVWAPERLNGDPDWEMERGINSVELLSFLKVAHLVSGDPRYAGYARDLIENHHYDRNVLEAPNLNPAWRTYIDLELLAFAYPALLDLETDPRLRRVYRASFERWHRTVRPDGNPFFEFFAARHLPRNRLNVAGAVEFLRGTPLDLVRWDVRNAEREDVQVRRAPEVENWQTSRLLPAAEIGYSRTDQNPWHARQGEGGRSESDGVFWLLPYWMGRQQGLLGP